MSTSKLNAMLYTTLALIGTMLAGCTAEVAPEDGVSTGEEQVAEVEQALDTCTPYGSGGGTWGDVITLCKTSSNYLYVMKRNGSFTSSGTMSLKTWLGTIYTTNIFAGQTTVFFGAQLSGWYYAVYESSAPGTAWTGEIQVP